MPNYIFFSVESFLDCEGDSEEPVVDGVDFHESMLEFKKILVGFSSV